MKKDLGERINRGNRETEKLKERMDQNDATFADRVAAVVGQLPSMNDPTTFSSAGQSSTVRMYASCFNGVQDSDPSANQGGPPPMAGRLSREDQYWICRRSLRIWPVVGDDVRKALGDFLKQRLRLSPVFLSDMGNVSVKKVADDPRSKITGEVVAIFATSEIRDTVRRAAKELGGTDNAGIWLEIPSSMKPSLKALEAVSYHLKQKHPNIKRNIKFDDTEMNLVLDFNVDPDGGSAWKRVSAAQAKVMKSKLGSTQSRTQDLSDAELVSLLDVAI